MFVDWLTKSVKMYRVHLYNAFTGRWSQVEGMMVSRVMLWELGPICY